MRVLRKGDGEGRGRSDAGGLQAAGEARCTRYKECLTIVYAGVGSESKRLKSCRMATWRRPLVALDRSLTPLRKDSRAVAFALSRLSRPALRYENAPSRRLATLGP